MYFRGRSSRNLDPKGRLMLPPEFRESLLARSAEGKFMLTTYDGCIVGFPWPDWVEFEEKFARIPNPSREMRNFRRLVIGGAEEQLADAQGRIRLSRDHLAYAGLLRESENSETHDQEQDKALKPASGKEHAGKEYPGKEAILVGQLNHFEIWSHERMNGVLHHDFDNVTQELSLSGIDFAL